MVAGGLPETAGWKWTAAREAAAGLVADGRDTEPEIATKVGISERTLRNWKNHPTFAARVAELVAAAAGAARALTIANKETRVRRLADRAQKLDAVFAARAEEHALVPGGPTGLLVREPKIVKVYDVKNWGGKAKGKAGDRGEDGENDEALTPTGSVRVVYEYKVDTGTLSELRAIEKQAAQELGEWVEKRDETQRQTVIPDRLDLSQLTDEELADLERLTGKATAQAG